MGLLVSTMPPKTTPSTRVPDACCASPSVPDSSLPRRWKRIAQALSRAGVEVRRRDGLWSFTASSANGEDPVSCEVLLPEDFPLERKALDQLMTLAGTAHPHGGRVQRCVATPDVHPGDAGIAIGSVVRTEDMLIPAAVGRDINCGMRLHVVDLPYERFEARRDELVSLLEGDLLLGTRDLLMGRQAMAGALCGGLLGWLEDLGERRGSLVDVDLSQVETELERVYELGSLAGSLDHVPVDQLAGDWVRDQVLGTIGGGNHFIEVQRVAEVLDGRSAWQWGVKEGQLAFMIHSGSRALGKAVGDLWKRRTQAAWPEGVERQPVLSLHAGSPALAEYLEAERTAANYGFLNRQLLAELVRRRLRQVFGDIEAPLVFDLPHNLTEVDVDPLTGVSGWVTRKGACPAHAEQPVIIPGSMGTSSYLMRGLGSRHLLESASHGAGRAVSRFELGRRGARWTEESLGLNGVDCITLREERRIEEAPAAYKPITPVIESQVAAGVVAPVARLEPVLTFKG